MSETVTENAPLTVVLVHGAFADASGWNGVIERLQAAGIQVTAPAIPLRGIAHDSAYVVDLVIHNYRWRQSLAEGEPQYGNMEARLFERPMITMPTVTIGSDFDGAAADGRALP
jgi:hypothetical protein